ncbi:MAG: hypothetical protein U1E23_11770 [Reyranellaceae bacterium]
MKRLVAVLALLLSTAACSGGISSWMDAWSPNFPQPNPGEAAIYLVRDAAPEGAPPINVTIGRRPVGSLTGKTWMLFNLQPRLYDIRAFGTQSSGEKIVTVAPGQTRFFQIEPTDLGGITIQEVSQTDGRRLVRAGEHVPETAVPPRGE